jgi:hypothetical protein
MTPIEAIFEGATRQWCATPSPGVATPGLSATLPPRLAIGHTQTTRVCEIANSAYNAGSIQLGFSRELRLMADERHVLREVRWAEVFPAVSLFGVWRLAINLRAVTFAVFGLLATAIGWQLIGGILQVDADARLQPAALQLPHEGGAAAFTDSIAPVSFWLANSPLIRGAGDLVYPFRRYFGNYPTAYSALYYILCALWTLAVWGIAGAAITRSAAVQLARDERLSWGSLLEFVRTRWLAYVAAPLFPMFGVLLASLPLAVFGLLLRGGSFGGALFAILWPVALLAGVVMAFLLVGLLINWPLMYATISSEGTDAFDALSRAYAYSFQRPLVYLGYVILAMAVGIPCVLFVDFFAAMVVHLAAWSVSWGSGFPNWAEVVSSGFAGQASPWYHQLVRFWIWLVGVFATGFATSYFFSAMTVVYFLLRMRVDATEMDEVYLPDEDEPYTMPPLTTDAVGVVQVADANLAPATPVESPEG